MLYSLLDLAPVPEGSAIPQALKNSTELAQKAESLGYHRYWLAEHHNMPGIASAAAIWSVSRFSFGSASRVERASSSRWVRQTEIR
jgi:alkanesulfonate monooxygenase SsuD/methylene tetrahydromethanopterin reductase-like flavin-dependent oxidoreductase (luciferase family)